MGIIFAHTKNIVASIPNEQAYNKDSNKYIFILPIILLLNIRYVFL
nr:MAG TPA: hypothetical protein [Caudoviricetes sp.]